MTTTLLWFALTSIVATTATDVKKTETLSSPQDAVELPMEFKVEGENLTIRLPRRFLIDRPFKLVALVPRSIRHAEATYWAAWDGDDCERQPTQEGTPLPIDWTEGPNGSRFLKIKFERITSPWWNYCVGVQAWRATEGPASPVQLATIVDTVVRSAWAGGSVDAMGAGIADKLLGNVCNLTSPSAADEDACALVRKKWIEDLRADSLLTGLYAAARPVAEKLQRLISLTRKLNGDEAAKAVPTLMNFYAANEKSRVAAALDPVSLLKTLQANLARMLDTANAAVKSEDLKAATARLAREAASGRLSEKKKQVTFLRELANFDEGRSAQLNFQIEEYQHNLSLLEEDETEKRRAYEAAVVAARKELLQFASLPWLERDRRASVLEAEITASEKNAESSAKSSAESLEIAIGQRDRIREAVGIVDSLLSPPDNNAASPVESLSAAIESMNEFSSPVVTKVQGLSNSRVGGQSSHVDRANGFCG